MIDDIESKFRSMAHFVSAVSASAVLHAELKAEGAGKLADYAAEHLAGAAHGAAAAADALGAGAKRYGKAIVNDALAIFGEAVSAVGTGKDAVEGELLSLPLSAASINTLREWRKRFSAMAGLGSGGDQAQETTGEIEEPAPEAPAPAEPAPAPEAIAQPETPEVSQDATAGNQAQPEAPGAVQDTEPKA